MQRSAFSALPILLALTLSSCGDPPPRQFRVGVLAALVDGYRESSGEPTVRGAELAAAEINEAGGVMINGRPHRLVIIVREHDVRPDDATTQARYLINLDSVHALIGPQLSSTAIAVAKIAEQAGVPMITPMSSNPETTRGKRFVFRLAFLDDQQANVLGKYAVEELGAERAAVLFDETENYSRGLAAGFGAAFERAGGSIVSSERFTSDQAETFVDQLTRIADADPDVIFLPNDALLDSIQMVEARALGIRARFLGSDVWDLQRLRSLPEAEGVLISHQWQYERPTPEVERFLETFSTVYGRIPRTTAAMTYDAVHILGVAAQAAGSTDSDALRAAIAALSDYRGATGTISFNGSADPKRSVALSTIRDGEIVGIRSIDPDPSG